MNINTKKASFAGSWYPGTSIECEKQINLFLKEKDHKKQIKKKLFGGIVPHAGWYFSGSIACNVIDCIKDESQTDLFVVFGMHLHPDSLGFIITQGAWETPFGEIIIDNDLSGELEKEFDSLIESFEAFSQDNTIELCTPFIKYFFPETKIIPIGVPPTKNSIEIGKAAAEISQKKGLNVKFIGSTDLTHYGLNYGFAPKGRGADAIDWVRNKNDRKFIDAVLDMNPVKILKEADTNHNACCAGAAAAAVAAAKSLGAEQAELVRYATSYDKRPDDSFVGYAGIVF